MNRPALEVDAPTLVVVAGARAGTRIKLPSTAEDGTDKKQWTIGSDADRDIIFDEMGVSGRHARIVNEGQRWKIINELAKNGTFVDGKRSNASYLSSGNELRFGSVTCVFELPKRGAAAVERVVERAVGRKLPVWVIALIVSFVVTGAIIVALSRWG
jgi:pSer/pThr/pTyr-binding forkhead associated (FHA) protein